MLTIKEIFEYEEKEAYCIKTIIVDKENNKNDYYRESIDALINYMKNNEQNPSENRWDRYAIIKKHLSSKTLGYLSGIGFNTLCRNIRKQINKNKRQIEE